MTSFIVTTAADENDTGASVGEPGGTGLSLREAIVLANNTAGVDTITFDASVFTGGDDSLIRLTQGELLATEAVSIDATGAFDVVITGDADGDDATVGSSNITDVAASFPGTTTEPIDLLDDNSRILNITADSGTTTLTNLTITGGRTTAILADGGGIDSAGNIALVNSTVSGNSTLGVGSRGGGIFSSSNTILTNSTVSGNSSGSNGGGIFSSSNTILTNSTVSDNSSDFNGGGIFSFNTMLTNSTVSDNVAGQVDGTGGGISSRGNTTLYSSTVSDNRTRADDGDGGGIFSGETTRLTNSTVSDNSTRGSSSPGGGIASVERTILYNSTVSGNYTFPGNGARSPGGGIFSGINTDITNSTISNNATLGVNSSGGGIYSFNFTSVVNSTVTGNTTQFGLVPVDSYFDTIGGGIYSRRGVVIENSIILSNLNGFISNNPEADDIAIGPGAMQPPRLMDTGSTFGPASLYAVTARGLNIVGTGTDTDPFDGIINADPMAVFAQVDSIVVYSARSLTATGGVLADNGGPVQTVQLLDSDSNPALDAVAVLTTVDGVNLGFDARGLERAVDIPNAPNAPEGTGAGAGFTSVNETGLGLDLNGDGEITEVALFPFPLRNDPAGLADIGAFELQINQPPVHSVPDAQTTNEDTPLVLSQSIGNGLSVDDPDGLNRAFETELSTTGGDLEVDSSAATQVFGSLQVFSFLSTVVIRGTLDEVNMVIETVTFTPDDDFNGTATITLTTDDRDPFTGLPNPSSGGFMEGVDVLNITVNPVDDAPSAADDTVTTNEDIAVDIDVASLITEVDGDTITITASVPADQGTVSVGGTVITYTPAANFNGTATISYTVTDDTEAALSDDGTLTVTVDPVDDAPVAEAGAAAGNEDTVINGQLVASDVDGDMLTFALDTQASNGMAVVNPDGSFTFTPTTNFTGTDTFTFSVTDGTTPVIETATITVNQNDTVTTNEDVVDATDGLTSLREAINFANSTAGVDTITFDASVFTGGDDSLIRLTEGELLITEAVNIDATGATNVVITGDAADDDVTIGSSNFTDVAASGAGLLDDNSRVLNITASEGTTTLANLTITGGRTTEDFAEGGGIRSSGNVSLINSTLSGNSTAGDDADGGGIYSRLNTTLINSTVTGNSTMGNSAEGGGIYSDGNTTLINSTISGNSTTGPDSDGAGVFSSVETILTNSIVLGNESAQTSEDEIGGGLTANGLNIVGTGSDTDGSDGIINADPTLVFAATEANGTATAGVLADNGGPVQTLALLPGSPAIDNGDDALAPANDARGASRTDVLGTGSSISDIGAFELSPIVFATTGADVIMGTAQDDILSGLADNDTLIGGLGADALIGGDGIDTANFVGSSAGVIVNLIIGEGAGGEADGDTFNSIENLTGSAFDDIFVASDDATANVFDGGAGNDVFLGLGGDDTLNGGAGDDLLLGGDGNDAINGDAGNDILEGDDGNDTINGGDDNDLIFGQGGDDVLNGDAGNDIILGDSGNDTIDGGADDDTILGGAGDNTLTGGLGDDLILGGNEADTVFGNEGADVIETNGGNDLIFTGDGNNIVLAGEGNDLVVGGTGIDTFVGGGGNDTLQGGDGADTLIGGLGNDDLFGGSGADQIIAQFGANELFGGAGADFLEGAEGDDVLDGGADTDFILGGAGNDTIDGGAGFGDQLIGGTGADTFVFSNGDQGSVVVDFNDDEDMLDLTAFSFTDVTTALATAVEVGADVFFDFNQDGSVTTLVNNITEAQLADDILV